MSENLQRFLAEWLEWVEKGAPDEEPFCRRRGLCSGLEDWNLERDFDVEEGEEELRCLFKADGLDGVYPFGGAEVFYEAVDHDEQHLNEARVAWVRSKVAQFEAA